MSVRPRSPDSRGANRRRGIFAMHPLLAGILVLALVVLAIAFVARYLDRRIERLEDSLDHPKPQIGIAASGPSVAVDRDTHLVYVPAYSHIYAQGGRRQLLEITLSVRNVSPNRSLTLVSVDYYDTAGKCVKRFRQTPRTLAPLETAEYLVAERDTTGGSGANFLVAWKGSLPPLCEAVMVGTVGDGYGVSFVREGVAVEGGGE